MIYFGHWEKAQKVSVEAFEEKMRHILTVDKTNPEAFAGTLLDFHAYAGEYRGIEVIEVRGKGSDLALVERMKLLEPEVKIRWTPIINLRRQLNIE